MVQAYKIVALAIAFASFGGVSAWQTQNWRYGLQIANIEAKASNDKLDALNAEIAKREEMENRKDEAIRNAESRAVENKAMADRSSSSIASLRKQLSSAESTYSKATDEARARHSPSSKELSNRVQQNISDWELKLQASPLISN